MKWRKYVVASWRSVLAGALLCAVLGVMLLALSLGQGLVHLSYDLLFRLPFRTGSPPEEVVIVQIDTRSLGEMGQTNAAFWSLDEHAKLLDRLGNDGARVVVFDIVFDSPFSHRAKTNFAAAIRRNGRVVVAAALDAEA